jgi:hypothetical protein
MSTILVNTLTGTSTAGSIAVTGEGNSTTTNLQQGLAKAFAKATNSAGLDDSFNVSGGTDNGTGDYTYAFTNNMASANYVEMTNSTYATLSGYDTNELATSSYNVRCFSRNDSITNIDDVNHSQITGDLA